MSLLCGRAQPCMEERAAVQAVTSESCSWHKTGFTYRRPYYPAVSCPATSGSSAGQEFPLPMLRVQDRNQAIRVPGKDRTMLSSSHLVVDQIVQSHDGADEGGQVNGKHHVVRFHCIGTQGRQASCQHFRRNRQGSQAPSRSYQCIRKQALRRPYGHASMRPHRRVLRFLQRQIDGSRHSEPGL